MIIIVTNIKFLRHTCLLYEYLNMFHYHYYLNFSLWWWLKFVSKLQTFVKKKRGVSVGTERSGLFTGNLDICYLPEAAMFQINTLRRFDDLKVKGGVESKKET